MKSRVSKTLKNHKKGYNCAQAVACAYCDLVGVDEATMFKMNEGFGLGMGGTEGICGAISGAVALAGLVNCDGDINNPKTKRETYKLSKEIVDKFREKNKAVTCKDLKGLETRKMLRTCDGCIEDAAAIVESVLFNNKEE